MPSSLGTAAIAAAFIFVVPPPPSVSEIPSLLEVGTPPLPNEPIASSLSTIPSQSSSCTDSASTTLTKTSLDFGRYLDTNRPTTPSESLIGEIREWSLLEADWDGEGAQTPSQASIRYATEFIRSFDQTMELPEPMLLSSGNISLVWNTPELYADLELLPDQRIAYFVKKRADKHKGVLAFEATMSPVLKALISS